MCSKVLNGHIILTDTSITTILAPEMTYTPFFPTRPRQTAARFWFGHGFGRNGTHTHSQAG
ncbi:hypothetical protein, partial [Phocaeicola massiliensis]|uniref:hypothetical protein n=1 Tax=Phocaeicola massiliensis TaxID=204516 RepID=UPI0032EBAB53